MNGATESQFNLPSLAIKFVFACSKQKSGEWKLSTNVDSTFSSELSLANSKIDGDGFCATCNLMFRNKNQLHKSQF